MANTKGELLAEGKTKKVFSVKEDSNLVILESKPDITAGDGKKHDVLKGKDVWANTTTCNVFSLLKDSGIPVAFREKLEPNSFLAPHCQMIPLEVIIRREVHGSELKRNPQLRKGFYFPRLVFQLFLKTTGKKWDGHDIPCDDPLIVEHKEMGYLLYEPGKPLWNQQPFLRIPPVVTEEQRKRMEEIARKAFLVLEKQWQILGYRLVDIKFEFGITPDEEIMIADVIDNDSWRLLSPKGEYQDKQVYREGGELSEVAENYQRVAALTERFGLPEQQIILWRGSKKDSLKSFFDESLLSCPGIFSSSKDLKIIGCPPPVYVAEVTLSMHKEPIAGYLKLHQLVQSCSDSVLIAFIGMSNGAGPTLAANCSIPVINVPASDNKHDIWSSLRMPSNVPCSTILSPKNAILHAVEILVLRNPALYAIYRYELEKRLKNIQEH